MIVLIGYVLASILLTAIYQIVTPYLSEGAVAFRDVSFWRRLGFGLVMQFISLVLIVTLSSVILLNVLPAATVVLLALLPGDILCYLVVT